MNTNPLDAGKSERTTKRDNFWFRLIPFWIAIIVLFLIVGVGQGVFHERWYTGAAERIASFVHFPILKVGGSLVTFPEFEEQRSQLESFQNAESDFAGVSDILPTSDTTQLVLTKLVKDQILEDAYQDHNVSVSGEELEQEFFSIYGTSSSSAEGIELVRETLGVSPEMLITGVLRQYVLKQKLTTALRESDEIQNQRLASITQVREQCSNDPQAFDAYLSGVKTEPYLTATYAGLVSPSDLRGDSGELRLLQEGDISSIIEHTDRYSIYRVVRKIADASEVKFLEVEELSVSKSSADEYVQQRLLQTHITVFDPAFTWKEECQQVVQKTDGCPQGVGTFAPTNWLEPQ